MNDDELLRYSRQIMLPDIDVAGQDKLLAGSAAIIGLGGLGSPAAMYLAASGIGRIVLVDDDVVDQTNLQRQIIHSENDVGVAKVTSAANSVHSLNAGTEIRTIDHRLIGTELHTLIESVDVVLDATDNFSSRYDINKACVTTQTPLVSGAAIRMEGQIAVFDSANPNSPCYQCLYSDGVDEELNCAENGVIAPLVGMVGTIQAMEAIKLIADFGESLVGYVLYVDAKRMEWRKFKLPRNENCPMCGDVSIEPSDSNKKF